MKDIFKIFLVLFVLFLPISYANAISISLEEALRTALSNSEDVGKANFVLERSREFIKEVKSMNRPKFSAELHYAVNDVRFYNNPGLIRNDTGFNAGASVEGSYVLYSFGLIKKSMEAATIAAEVSAADRQDILDDLSMRVKIAYYAAAAAKQNEKILENALIQIKNLINSERNKSAKDSAFLEGILAEAESALETSKYLSMDSLRLLSILCATYEPITDISDSFDTLSAPDINALDLAKKIEISPKIIAMRKSVDLGLKNARKEEAANAPSLNLFGRYSFSDQSPRPILTDPLWIGRGYAGIGLSIPIYDGGLAKSKGRQERLAAYIAMSKLEQERRILIESLAGYGEKYEAYKIAAESNARSAASFEKAYEEYLKDYEKGKVSALETFQILNMLVNARLKKTAGLYNIYESLARIEKITGSSPF